MKFSIQLLLLSVIICLLSGCDKKQHTFNNNQFKNAIKLSLNDKDLKIRMGLLQENKVKNWILNGNFTIKDTIDIDGRHYRFSDEKSYSKSDSNIFYKIAYANTNLAHIRLQYTSTPSSMIFGDYYFEFKGGDWKFIRRVNGVADGKFK